MPPGPLNPEPHAYESRFAVKWLIGDQIAGKAERNYDPAKGPGLRRGANGGLMSGPMESRPIATA